MKDFYRVLRLAFRYRLTFVLSLVCALGVAVLWGTNIGAVYPFVEVAFRGESLQDWVNGRIATARQAIDDKNQQIDRYRALLDRAPAEQDELLGNWIEAQREGPSAESAVAIRKCRALLAKTGSQRRRAIAVEIDLARSRVQAEEIAAGRYGRIKPYIDIYLPHDPFQTMLLIASFLLVGTVVKDLFLIGNSILVARLAHLTMFDLRKLFYRRTLRMDLATFGEEGTADLMARFTFDMEALTAGLVAIFGKLIREPLKMSACLISAAVINWRLLLLSLVFAPLAGLLVRWLAKTLKQANRRAMEEMAQIYTTLEETFRGIKIVKAFTNEPQERKRFHAQSKKYYKDAMRIARYDSLSRPITEVMGIVAICLALMAGAWLVLSGETHLLGIRMSSRPLTLASLLLFYALLAGAADPIRKLSDIFTRLQRAAAAADRIYAQLDRQPTVRDPDRPLSVRRHHRELVFESVEFGYRPDQPVLKNIDLKIGFGETIAMVGPNGCGKSTLVNLILRFYDPVAGTIRLDGVPLDRMRLRDLRRQIGTVTQETLLFDDTILNNIRYGSPQATQEEVIEAAKQAHAHRFIEDELPDGYETVVGAMGNRLSGGQRQRIALARAILRDPAILILDEATSQIDLESERAIQQVLEKFVRNRTAVIITHRMAVLALADRIVVMQAGRILDVGTHEELLARCELYRRLYQIQFEDLKQSA